MTDVKESKPSASATSNERAGEDEKSSEVLRPDRLNLPTRIANFRRYLLADLQALFGAMKLRFPTDDVSWTSQPVRDSEYFSVLAAQGKKIWDRENSRPQTLGNDLIRVDVAEIE